MSTATLPGTALRRVRKLVGDGHADDNRTFRPWHEATSAPTTHERCRAAATATAPLLWRQGALRKAQAAESQPPLQRGFVAARVPPRARQRTPPAQSVQLNQRTRTDPLPHAASHRALPVREVASVATSPVGWSQAGHQPGPPGASLCNAAPHHATPVRRSDASLRGFRGVQVPPPALRKPSSCRQVTRVRLAPDRTFGGHRPSTRPSGRRDLEVATDLPGQMLVDLAVPRDGGSLPRLSIDVDRMVRAFAQQLASVRREVTNEIDSLQATETRSGSRRTSLPAISSSARARLASRTS